MNRKLSSSELMRPDKETAKKMDKLPVVFVLDNVRSALNVGSVFRTADGFGISEICLCGITAQPPQRDILKSALGATETVDWSYHASIEDAIQQLQSTGHKIIAIEQTKDSILLPDFTLSNSEKYAFVFGNEVNGVSDVVIPLSDACVEIPQTGMKHSLNIAVCAGIMGWEAMRQLNTESGNVDFIV